MFLLFKKVWITLTWSVRKHQVYVIHTSIKSIAIKPTFHIMNIIRLIEMKYHVVENRSWFWSKVLSLQLICSPTPLAGNFQLNPCHDSQVTFVKKDMIFSVICAMPESKYSFSMEVFPYQVLFLNKTGVLNLEGIFSYFQYEIWFLQFSSICASQETAACWNSHTQVEEHKQIVKTIPRR